MTNVIGAIIVATFIFHGMELSAGERRHVVATKRVRITINSYALWTSKQARDACVGAMKSVILSGKTKTAEDVERDPDVNKFCETGFAGLKPIAGLLNVGSEVELLDSRECSPMVFVRALSGKLSGETGCIEAEALLSPKPTK